MLHYCMFSSAYSPFTLSHPLVTACQTGNVRTLKNLIIDLPQNQRGGFLNTPDINGNYLYEIILQSLILECYVLFCVSLKMCASLGLGTFQFKMQHYFENVQFICFWFHIEECTVNIQSFYIIRLHHTITAAKFSCSHFLLELGANPNVEDRDGNTPIHLACKAYMLDCVDRFSTQTIHKMQLQPILLACWFLIIEFVEV